VLLQLDNVRDVVVFAKPNPVARLVVGARISAVRSERLGGIETTHRSFCEAGLGLRNIRVNSVAIGYFESEMERDLTEEQKQRIVRRMPFERLASAADVANAVYFLVSEQASFITGQILVVDRGITC
jgi:3-oxoacyl-[acyl-carrier protein] reductase